MARRRRSSINAEIDVLDTQIQTYKRREAEFQRLIDDLQKLKAEVTEERRVAEAQKMELEALKEPVNWLPPELLAQVFLELADMDHGDADYRPPMVVSQVCDKWRTIAISTPRLWRRVRFQGWIQPGLFKLYMTRSANVPIELDYASILDLSPTKEMLQIAGYLSKSLKHTHRAESFSLQCNSAPAFYYIVPPLNDHCKTFPMLRYLNLSIVTNGPSFSEVPHLLKKEKDTLVDISTGTITYVPNDSTLIRLRLEEVPLFCIPVTFMANLRCLELSFSPKPVQPRDYYYLKMSTLCRFLTFTPFLEELILVNTVPCFDVALPALDGSTTDSADNSVTRMKPVRLEHLKAIDWTWPYTGDVHRFLSMIDAPALEKLDLWVEDLPQKRVEPYHHAWRNAQTPSFSPHNSLRDAITYTALRDLSLQSAGDDSTPSVLRKFAFPALEKVAFTNVVTAQAGRPGANGQLPYFPRLESIFRDPRLPNLTHLTLSHFRISPEPGRVEALFGYTPFLTSLSLESCTGVRRLMEVLKEQVVGAIKPLLHGGGAGGVTREDKGGVNKGTLEGIRPRPQRGVKVCPRLEALSFWGCQDVDLVSIRAVISSRNSNVQDSSAAELAMSNGATDAPNGAIPAVTRNLRDGNAGVADGHGQTTWTTEVSQMGRKIKPLRKSRRHPVESGLSSSADAGKELVAPSTNIASSIIAMQEAFRPANIIYLRMVNCPLISKEEASSVRDLGVVDVIWAGSD